MLYMLLPVDNIDVAQGFLDSHAAAGWWLQAATDRYIILAKMSPEEQAKYDAETAAADEELPPSA